MSLPNWWPLLFGQKSTITTMVNRRTRKDEDYANYKEALNLATTEIRKSKRKKNWQVIKTMTARVSMLM